MNYVKRPGLKKKVLTLKISSLQHLLIVKMYNSYSLSSSLEDRTLTLPYSMCNIPWKHSY